MKVSFKLALVLMVLLLCPYLPGFAQETMAETVTDTLKGMSDLFGPNLNTSQTLGKPFEAGEYTIIPVVAKGLVFGLGTKLEAKDKEVGNSGAGKNENLQKDRIGLGGGGFVKPVALIMIKKDGTFKVVRLCEGIFAQLAKHMLPAIGSMVRKTIKTISAEKIRHDKMRHQQHKAKKVKVLNKAAAEAPSAPVAPAVKPAPAAPVSPVIPATPAVPAN